MDTLLEWMAGFGRQYGVNPVIFALLYFGTIPFSLYFFRLLVKNFRAGKSLFVPVSGMFLCFIGTYIYLFWVGKNIPAWVWVIVAGMALYGAFSLVIKIRSMRQSPGQLP
ncbi:MAG: hypothetical protein D6714_20565 [Bacteroidetes bacterium]|nr:MAG: hypothetical protein D6714_20565 [Bacteroidota bacterium]